MKSPAAIKAFLEKENVFVAAVLFLYLLIAGFTIYNHEMWRDELQAWMLVKASPAFASLLQNIRYEGHPLLWFTLLWLLKFFSTKPEAIQVLHFAIAAASAFTWLKFAPFSKLHRALFVFGYYPLYEYAVISRNYAIGVLLVFIFCAIYQRHRKNFILLAFILFLLMQSNFFAMLIALAIGFGLAVEIFLSRKTHIYSWQKMLVASGIFLAGLILSLYTILPPHDHFFGGTWREGFSLRDIAGTLTVFGRSMVPVPSPELHFWNTNILAYPWARLFLSALLVLFSFICFHKKRWVLAIFFSGLLAMLLFFYMRMFGSLRHQGHIYLLFITCFWLYKNLQSKDINLAYIRSWINTLLTLLFTLHICGSAIACYTDWKFPFSAAKQTADFIMDNNLSDLALAGDADMIVATVSGYLEKPVYYPLINSSAEYIVWNRERDKVLTETEIIESVRKLMLQENKDVLLILTYPLNNTYPHTSYVKSFTQSIEASEAFYLYRLKMLQ